MITITMKSGNTFTAQIGDKQYKGYWELPLVAEQGNFIILSPFFTEHEFRVFQVHAELTDIKVVDNTTTKL